MSTPATTTADLAEMATRYLNDPTSRREPYEFWTRLREEAPVYRTPGGVWLISGYDAAGEILRNDAALSRREARLKHHVVDDPEAELIYTSRMLDNDRPEHTRLRRLVSYAFTRGGAAKWTEDIAAAAHERIDALEHHHRMEVVHELAYPIVEQIITDLLGIRHGDLDLFLEWSKSLVESLPGTTAEDIAAQRESANKAMLEVAAYVREQIEFRRDAPGEDLLTRLIKAEAEDGKLAEHEVVAVTFELIFAGYETTSNFVPNGLYHLLANPEQFAALRDDRSLLGPAIEEMLRFESPAPMPLPRVAVRDVELEGQTIRQGDTVVVLLAAANRDPRVFNDPDTFNIHRNENPHISFGFGAHYCLGNALARLESTEIFTVILNRLPSLRLDGEPVWSDHQFFRSLAGLPVAW